jgi:LCP family protein required for cell wall assembly
MSGRSRQPLLGAALSALVPGVGQLYVGAHRRGAVLLGIWIALCTAAFVAVTQPETFLLLDVGPWLLAAVLAVNVAVGAYRVLALVDAGRGAASRAAVATLAVLAGIAAAPHVALGYVAVRGYGVLDSVFADEEPGDVFASRGIFLVVPPLGREPRDLDPPAQRPLRATPEPRPRSYVGRDLPLATSPWVVDDEAEIRGRPWVTILLLGSDEGPRQRGDRTDTMIVAAIQRDTGRAVLFGVPRNLVGVEIGFGRRFNRMLNALYQFGNARPDLFPGGRDPGATALKQAISMLLGIRIDYYAMVDLDGFVDVVDALGGVRIAVKERILDEVTRPEWGETKPKIDVYPGRTYHFSGRTALAYVRSRKGSSDYRRMARQRCFLSALADQVDVRNVLRHFGSLARAVRSSVRTDVPLARAPDLVRLAAGVDPRRTLTETFGPDYFAGVGAEGYLPNVPKIQSTVRTAILHPELAQTERSIESVRKSC